MAGYAEKVQHLRRCSTQTIHKPRVACTIVWQPWAIKGATPTALKRVLHDVINVYAHMYKWQVTPKRYNTYSVVPHKLYVNPG